MITFRKILCPVDFSDPAKEALAVAADLAKQYRADLWVLHVIVPTPSMAIPGAYPMGVTVPEYQSELEAESRKALDQFLLNAIPPDVSAHSVLVMGEAGAEIARYAEEQAMDLIVISSHGRTGWQRLMFGSVAEKVVRHAPCAVLTVRAPRPEPEAKP